MRRLCFTDAFLFMFQLLCEIRQPVNGASTQYIVIRRLVGVRLIVRRLRDDAILDVGLNRLRHYRNRSQFRDHEICTRKSTPRAGVISQIHVMAGQCCGHAVFGGRIPSHGKQFVSFQLAHGVGIRIVDSAKYVIG